MNLHKLMNAMNGLIMTALMETLFNLSLITLSIDNLSENDYLLHLFI